MGSEKAFPDVVYHYTSVTNLASIISSGELWATNLNYLNDVSEGQLFLRAAKRRLPMIKSLSHLNHDLMVSLLNEEPHTRPVHEIPFIVSFTKHRNSLPQWRAYCHEGNGVSIGFRTNHIQRDQFEPYGYGSTFGMNSPVTSLHSVTYLADLDDGLVDRFLSEDAADVARMFGVKNVDETQMDWRVKARAATVKDESFTDEGEYRLIVHNVSPSLYSPILGVRTSKTTLVPFIKVPLSTNVGPDEPGSPICEVVVGPCPNPTLTVEAVRFLLTISGIDAEVSSSLLPYRDL